jgi:hypothetical protein
MDHSSQYDEWARHFDNLVWTVTSILVAANGALLVHLSNKDNFHPRLAIGGLLLSVATVYLVASMRELRQRFQSKLDEPTQALLSKGRKLYQWHVFVGIFLMFIVFWTWLFVEFSPACTPAWLTLGGASLIAAFGLGIALNSSK